MAVVTLVASPAFSLSLEQARENCRATIGKPFVHSCMQSLGGGKSPNADANREACRAKARPQVTACMHAALNAANGRANVPMAIPKEAEPKAAAGNALPAGFVAPPRTIADISAILDSEKPDPKKIAELKDDADSQPTGKESRQELVELYFDRANARAQLGQLAASLADVNKAIELGRGTVSANLLGRMMQLAVNQYTAAGDPKKALEMMNRQLREVSNLQGGRGYQIGANRGIARILVQMGDIPQAEATLRRSLPHMQTARTSGLPGWRASYATYGQNWEAEIELGKALIYEAKGQFREAEESYHIGEQRKRAAIKGMLSSENPPTETLLLQGVDGTIISQARMKLRQGRIAEAEVDARRALLSRLKDQGKYNAATPPYIMTLADVLVEQGRYAEAEQLARTSIDINRTVGVADDSLSTVQLLSQLGNVLNLQGKWEDAAAAYARVDRLMTNWEPARRQAFELNSSRIMTLIKAGQVDAGIAAAEQLVRKKAAIVGDNHFDTASARGLLAVGLMRAGRTAEAIREFKASIPLLVAATRENSDDDDASLVAARTQRLQSVVEAYFTLLARDDGATAEVGRDTFALADSIRGRSVQQALVASSARAAVKDPALADVVRKEQDLAKQINAQLGTLTNALSLPSGERDDKGVQSLNASIASLRNERAKVRQDIARRFPAYAELVAPKSPSVDEIQATLVEGEALLSFYFGQSASFVWAVPKQGPIAFAKIDATGGDIETKVRKLREALEPQSAMITDIPEFDAALAHELYQLLLKPVEGGWKPAKSLILVSNGALGLLPLSLLPTAPPDPKLGEGDPLFASYRNVAWLARTHAVTSVPSAAALRTLRQLGPGKPGRSELVAFGDPYFSKAQMEEATAARGNAVVADAAMTTRGLPLKRRNSPKLEGVDSADLAMLPRLPDTADELKSIALALQADPSKVLNLGKDASENTVKTMNLSGFKVIAFATHGLVPGELNGLTQPALALSSPAVTGDGGDGLLTMEEILALKLAADWVVLSACNTGTGVGAGAEAASGLGRAFFYAGTRALLVTNWSVHSQSARELVTDLFKRQADNSHLPRAEALRQAMMGLVDGPGYRGADGNTLFGYAHPLFWAPYTIIGDGGVR